MVMLVTICIWHAIIFAAIAASGVPADVVFWVDKWVLVALAIIYVLINLTFVLVICCGVSRLSRPTLSLWAIHVGQLKQTKC